MRFRAAGAPFAGSIILVAAVVMTSGGCDTFTRGVAKAGIWGAERADGFANKRAHDDAMIVEVGGPIFIDIDSFNGDVTVDVDPDLDHAIVEITRRARHGYKRSEEAKLSLGDILCTVDLVAGPLGQVLEVRSDTVHAEPHFQSVDIHIRAPEVNGFRVHTHNGDVWARDIRGAVDVSTDDGSVRIMTNFAMLDPVTIVNSTGDIDFRVRGESAGRVDARTVRGKVVHYVDFGQMVIHPGTKHDTLLATFNDGANMITLRTVDGDIRFASVAAPTHVGSFVFQRPGSG